MHHRRGLASKIFSFFVSHFRSLGEITVVYILLLTDQSHLLAGFVETDLVEISLAVVACTGRAESGTGSWNR